MSIYVASGLLCWDVCNVSTGICFSVSSGEFNTKHGCMICINELNDTLNDAVFKMCIVLYYFYLFRSLNRDHAGVPL